MNEQLKRFYQEKAMEYRQGEYNIGALAKRYLDEKRYTSPTTTRSFGPTNEQETHTLYLMSAIGKGIHELKTMYGLEIGAGSNVYVKGALHRFDPKIHNLQLDNDEPDLVKGETIVVTHSEITMERGEEYVILLHAVFDRLWDNTEESYT